MYNCCKPQVNASYRQFVQSVADDAAQFAMPGLASSVFSWLAGEWIWRGAAFTFRVEDYGISVQPPFKERRPFLIHQAFADMWVLVQSDPAAYGMLVGSPMRSGEAQFTGDIHVSGKDVRLQQRWRRDTDLVEIEHSRMRNRVWTRPVRSLLERITPAGPASPPETIDTLFTRP